MINPDNHHTEDNMTPAPLIPKTPSVAADCCSADDIIRFIDLTKDGHRYPDFDAASQELNRLGCRTDDRPVPWIIMTSPHPWTETTTKLFYDVHTEDETANKKRRQFPNHQIWSHKQISDAVAYFVQQGYDYENVGEWFTREKIIHYRWRATPTSWSRSRVQGAMNRSKKNNETPNPNPRRTGARSEATKITVAAHQAAENTGLEIRTPLDLAAWIYTARENGCKRWELADFALYFNHHNILRGNYRKGRRAFTIPTVHGLFRACSEGLNSRDPEPAWIRQYRESNVPTTWLPLPGRNALQELRSSPDSYEVRERMPNDETAWRPTKTANEQPETLPEKARKTESEVQLETLRVVDTSGQFVAEVDIALESNVVTIRLELPAVKDPETTLLKLRDAALQCVLTLP